MKVASFVISVALATSKHVYASPLSPLSSEDITESSSCQDYGEILKKLEDEVSSASFTCKIDVSDEGDAINPAQSISDRFIQSYYRVCDFFCTCPGPNPSRFLQEKGSVQDSALQEEEPTDATLEGTGQCDAVKDAITALDSVLDSQSDCIKSSQRIRPRDVLCFSPFAECDAQAARESICAGWYEKENCDLGCGCCGCKCATPMSEEDGNRMLKETDNMSMEDILEEIRSHGANPNGIYAKKELFPQDVCAKAVEFMDKQTDDDFQIPSQFHGKMKDRILTGDEFVQVFGKSHGKNLLDFFHESLGYKAPITDMKIYHVNVDDQLTYFTSHTDHVEGDSMIVFLNTIDGAYHYTAEGLMKTEYPSPGMAIVHGKDVLHKSLPFSGSHDVLKISSSPHANESTKCMLSDIVN